MSTDAATQVKHRAVMSSLDQLSIGIAQLEEIVARIAGTPTASTLSEGSKSESVSLGPALSSWPSDIDESSKRVREAVAELEGLLY